MNETNTTTNAAVATQTATVLDGTPYLVCEKGGIRCLHIEGKQAVLKTVRDHFCGPIFVSRESGEKKMVELANILPGFEFELLRREDLPLVRTLANGVTVRCRK
jgi:hypothetical protein